MSGTGPDGTRPHAKSLLAPDELIEVGLVRSAMVNVGGMTVSHDVQQPGWRWSTHIKPFVGTESCQVAHLGLVLAGRLHVRLDGGDEFELGPWDIADIPAGHDAWVVGDEPYETIAWRGARTWLEPLAAMTERVLATILMTDLVDSTGIAAKLGDRAWGDRLAAHDEMVRDAMVRYRGRLVKLTGDGALATFDSPGRALRCAVALRDRLLEIDLASRGAVTTGEIEIAGDDIRGLAVHEASRMLALAARGEIVVGEMTRTLGRDAGVTLVDRGEVQLRGLDGRFRLASIPPP
jgi:class 3 adenylate cyclase